MGQQQESEWIEWTGGDAPTCDRVDVRFRNGEEQLDHTTASVRAFFDWGRFAGKRENDVVAYRPLAASTPNTPASNDFVLVKAATQAEDAMREMFRYYDGGETRGSYDGKPERAGLRKAWYALRSALAAAPASPEPASNEAPGRGGVEAFGAAVFRLSWDAFMDGQFDVDLERITKAAVEAGLLKVCPFDPEVHNDETGAAEAGDDFYQPTEAGLAILRAGAAA